MQVSTRHVWQPITGKLLDKACLCAAAAGILGEVEWPEGVRVDTWVDTGTNVTPYYDSLLAKLMVYAPTRKEAIAKLASALNSTKVRKADNQPISSRGHGTAEDFTTNLSSAPVVLSFCGSPAHRWKGFPWGCYCFTAHENWQPCRSPTELRSYVPLKILANTTDIVLLLARS